MSDPTLDFKGEGWGMDDSNGHGLLLHATRGDNSSVFLSTYRKGEMVRGRHLSISEAKQLRSFITDLLGDEEDWQQKVIDAVVDFPQGCRDQKAEFLKTLGLELPKLKTTFEVTVEHGDEDWRRTDIELALSQQFPYAIERGVKFGVKAV